MTEPSTSRPSPRAEPDRSGTSAETGTRQAGRQEPPAPGPRDANRPADIAPEGPTTAYEYPRGDRGAAATEHEQQVCDSLAGPSRDDTARGR